MTTTIPGGARRDQEARFNQPAMTLPPYRLSSGEVETVHAWLGVDSRIPEPLRAPEVDPSETEHAPRVIAPHRRCVRPGERHLWDIIESAAADEVEGDDGEYEEHVTFRARLTCVRCGAVQAWAGRRREHDVDRLEVVPLSAGDYVAQMVKVGPLLNDRRTSVWEIYRDGHLAGRIMWGLGTRGRLFYTARLNAWPVGAHVEGPTPVAALRKLARQGTTPPPTKKGQ